MCKECSNKKNYENLSKFEKFVPHLINQLKNNSKKSKNINKLNITIDSNDIFKLYEEQKGRCFYTNLELTHNKIPNLSKTTKIGNPRNISIDRTDSSKGYTIDNIKLVCAQVNIMKWNLLEKSFLQIIDDIITEKRKIQK